LPRRRPARRWTRVRGRSLSPEPTTDALVLFGATGDLAHKKIFPALYRMVARNVLDMPVIGVASSTWSDDELRQHARDSIEKKLKAQGSALDDAVWERLAPCLTYVSGDYREASVFDQLAEKLKGRE